ncbi:MAG TPA: hypothetical protein VH083_28720 [Myxococcales bacterium]|jgi:hypothetical protein|nr:hypothetical protein [Myxococcales bacterium]
MKKLLIAALLISSSAFAKTGSPQTHHCEVNGAEVAKTHKECSAAKGKWAKGAPTTAAPATSAPATPPATK